jgi:uncharacterized protein (TIGR02145 family)
MKSSQILMMGNSIGIGNGFLYNWFAASDANFAPTDWKVPTNAELQTLTTYLGGISVAGGKMKTTGTIEAGTGLWRNPNTGADNSSNFSKIPSGARSHADGAFSLLQFYGYLWSSSSFDANNAHARYLFYNGADVNEFTYSKKAGFSVRLLYTGAGTPATVTDYDGNVYDTVVIGTQRWTKQNWKCTRLNNGTSIPNVTDGTTWAGLTTLARAAYDNNINYV